MATFVMVHGAFAGGWVWNDAARALERTGHRVYAPSLTGLGEPVGETFAQRVPFSECGAPEGYQTAVTCEVRIL